MRLFLEEIAHLFGVPSAGKSLAAVRGVSVDTRTIESGMIFFALQGEHHDGHAFIEEAFRKGACAAVMREGFRLKSPGGIVLPVADTLIALQTLAAYYRNKFYFPVFAITGSNGKTTTKELLSAVLGTEWQVRHSGGNLNNHIGVPLSILEWDDNTEMAVLEMGTNHFGEIRRLCEIARPTHGILTNIGRAHLQYFKDQEGVLRAKSELLDAVMDSRLYINGDDTLLLSVYHKYPDAVLYGLSERCHVRARVTGTDSRGFPWFTVDHRKFQLGIPGRQNIYNALAALAAAREMSVSWAHIHEAFATYRAFDSRMEIRYAGEFMVVNDSYNANPDSVYQALLTLHDFDRKGRRIAVLGDMAELGRAGMQAHEQIAEWMQALKMDAFFGIGEAMAAAVKVAQKRGFKQAFHFEDKKTLLEELSTFLKTGDIVLVKGSRFMHMEDIVTGLEKRFN